MKPGLYKAIFTCAVLPRKAFPPMNAIHTAIPIQRDDFIFLLGRFEYSSRWRAIYKRQEVILFNTIMEECFEYIPCEGDDQ